jgi:hypothetical protein
MVENFLGLDCVGTAGAEPEFRARGKTEMQKGPRLMTVGLFVGQGRVRV